MHRRMQSLAPVLATLLVLATAGPAPAVAAAAEPAAEARALAADGPVSVRWEDPAGFSEMRSAAARWDMANRGDWVRQLAEHLRERAESRLAPGERLDVVITDVKRAGDYEPWQRGNTHDVRIIRDVYPPRMSLSWRRTGADGALLDEGERRIVDGGFLSGSRPPGDSDPLRYEKRLVDDWVRDVLARPGA